MCHKNYSVRKKLFTCGLFIGSPKIYSSTWIFKTNICTLIVARLVLDQNYSKLVRTYNQNMHI